MSPPSGAHRDDHAELVFAYALQALPASEIPVVEAHIAACAQCRQEMETLGPIVQSFTGWPTDLLRPSTSLWERVVQRIGAETIDGAISPAPRRWEEPEWAEVAPGISCKLLATDTERNRVSMLVRLAPGTDYPPHRHGAVEELHLLDGELYIDDKKLSPGDYNRAEAGSSDYRVWSETGCTCVLITSTRDELR
jgi:anti-sigma factor ChrR (cupin superfamily)